MNFQPRDGAPPTQTIQFLPYEDPWERERELEEQDAWALAVLNE